jgi:hypothetical protein
MQTFKKISRNDESGYSPFEMFGSVAGSAKYLRSDGDDRRFAGFFRTDIPLKEGNEWYLDLEEVLYVTEGELTIKFLPKGDTLVVGVGEMAFIPAGSRISLTITKLPFSEAFTLVAPVG